MGKIIKHIFYEIDVEFASPVNVSSGERFYTDSDVMINGSGEFIIPGTTLAGAFRNYIYEEFGETAASGAFGYTQGEQGKMSSVFISDMVLSGTGNPMLGIRDFVVLKEDKSVDNKFDAQIIETGSEGKIEIEYLMREGTEDIEAYIFHIIHGIEYGDIRIGGNKNRGFGRMKVNRIRSASFTEGETLEKYLEGQPGYMGEGSSYDEWKADHPDYHPKYIKVRVPLKISGGISIRTYSAKPGHPDYGHITSNDKPVIPGSSWNGALRKAALRILRDLGMSEGKARKQLEEWFGYVEKKKARQSMIVFSESVIDNAEMLNISRNQIDRFSGATVKGALYTERACFGGNTVLEYMIKKNRDAKALLELMDFVTEDLINGYVAVGGLTAIGRGLFELDGTIEYINSPYDDTDEDELVHLVMGRDGNNA